MTQAIDVLRTADVFKVLPAALWQDAIRDGAFKGSADDIRDGFIHLSTADQLSGTLAKYFRGLPDLLVVAFASESFGPLLKWEASRGGQLFPHVYGAIPVELALWQRPLRLGTDGIPVMHPDSR